MLVVYAPSPPLRLLRLLLRRDARAGHWALSTPSHAWCTASSVAGLSACGRTTTHPSGSTLASAVGL
jgi:hypothetical protein